MDRIKSTSQEHYGYAASIHDADITQTLYEFRGHV